MQGSGYVGRFAPSPTGRLHMGSLIAALASWCDARHRGGQWLVRMEDLDPPREVPGAADDILSTLEGFGLTWDGSVRYQSKRQEAYADALEMLIAEGRAFGCACTRKMLADHAVYPGTCKQGIPGGQDARSYRFIMPEQTIHWQDEIQGPQSAGQEMLDDFVVRRADGFWAYQLAVVVDDVDQGVNAVVRGADLMDSTPGQMALWDVLGAGREAGHWGHLPLLVNAAGQKWSKQTLAEPLEVDRAPYLLMEALQLLGQLPAGGAGEIQASAGVSSILSWAVDHWRMDRVPAAPLYWQGGQS